MTEAREIAALVPMPRLLATLGFEVNERIRRCACRLHGGSNPTAFAWREDGYWRCFSCGRGGDRIALVRNARECSFREALEFLAGLAGVKFRFHRRSRVDVAITRRRRDRAERAAWRIADEIGRLRRYYTDALHRCERLQRRIGGQLLRASRDRERERTWDRLARLAPVCTFFLAAWSFMWDAKPESLACFALASAAERRQFFLVGIVL